jgi:FkbM family methyltransferase
VSVAYKDAIIMSSYLNLNPLKPVSVVAALTRRLQALSPNRPLKGLTRVSNLLDRWMPGYQGVIRLQNGVLMTVDSRQPAERWLLYAGNYQPALTAFLKRHTPAGGTCLDVGANLGFYALSFARWVGPHGRVVAFEANPALVEHIAHDVSLNKFDHVTLIDRPIHSRAEPVAFYISPSPGKSSIHTRQVANPVQTLTLTATTIDLVSQEQNWTRLDVIKLDIEGNNCNALLGARESLARFRPVIAFEYWYSTPAEIAEAAFGLLDDLGYRLEGLLRNGKRLSFDWRIAGDFDHIDVIGSAGDGRHFGFSARSPAF